MGTQNVTTPVSRLHIILLTWMGEKCSENTQAHTSYVNRQQNLSSQPKYHNKQFCWLMTPQTRYRGVPLPHITSWVLVCQLPALFKLESMDMEWDYRKHFTRCLVNQPMSEKWLGEQLCYGHVEMDKAVGFSNSGPQLSRNVSFIGCPRL